MNWKKKKKHTPEPVEMPPEIPEVPWKKVRRHDVMELVSRCLESGLFAVDGHCRRRMRDRNIAHRELLSVLATGGLVDRPSRQNPEWKKDSSPPEWSYLVEGVVYDRRITVVLGFRETNAGPFMLVYTCWRSD